MMINDDKRNMIFTIIVLSLVIFSPVILKWVLNENNYLSEDTYYHVRMTEHFKENFENKEDVLQKTEYNFNFFHFIFSKVNFQSGVIPKILPAILGIISILLFYLLLTNLNLGHNDIFFAMIILASTPVFLYNFTTFSPEIIALPIFLIGLILFVRGNYLSSVFFGATAFVNIFYTLLGLGIVIGSYVWRKKDNISLGVNSGVIVLSLLAGMILLKINYGSYFIPLMTGLNGFLIEFGAIKGYALISLGLALIGLFKWWSKEASKTSFLVIVMLMILFSIFFQNLRLPTAIIISVFAGFSISYLANREWEIFVLKGVTLLLVFCILFFSAILALNFQIKNISEKEVNAISYLASANSNDIILSVERNGFIIEYESGRSAYLDGNSYKFDDYSAKKTIAESIYYTRNLDDLEALLVRERITHILVDSEMKSGEIWNGRSEGLLFFLENSGQFIKIFYDEDIQIYRYVGRELK